MDMSLTRQILIYLQELFAINYGSICRPDLSIVPISESSVCMHYAGCNPVIHERFEAISSLLICLSNPEINFKK